jgi:hypothetical protein
MAVKIRANSNTDSKGSGGSAASSAPTRAPLRLAATALEKTLVDTVNQTIYS